MFYRINCILESGESRGYQWRELSQQEFVAIATGTRPVGDTESQTRDSTELDTAAGNRPIYYGAVWQPDFGWVTDVSSADAETLYITCAYERAGA
jgi:hypothetical protein